MSVHSITGRLITDDKPGANLELVGVLKNMLADAEAGRLVAVAGVLGRVDDQGVLDFRLWTHTNNWEVHDRLLARVSILRGMMENDFLAKTRIVRDAPGPSEGA